jgi:prepilin signal peptidase PulO-like enzyme (type II secretory pathway)
VKVLFLVAGLVLAAQVAPAESPFVLSLEQPRGVYVLGERVPVVARAQATAETSVQVSGPPFSAWAEDSSGLVVWRWVPPQRPGGWRKATVRLRQGGALGFAASWTPPRPGRYTVLVEFRPAGLRAKSVILVREKSRGVFAVGPGQGSPWVVWLFSGIAGLFLGSFAGVVGHRLLRGEQFVWGRSRCDSCGKVIPAAENIPVLSWFLLKGKCSACGARIPPVYPAVELLCGVFMGLAGALFGPSVALVASAVLCVVLAAATVADLQAMVIPDQLTLGGVAAALVIWGVATRDISAVVTGPVLAGLGFGGLLLVAALLRPDGMGGGDVKLAAAAGAFLGFPATAVAAFLSVVMGGLYALFLLARGRDRRSVFPFGPFIAAGTAVAALFGEVVWAWYTGMR